MSAKKMFALYKVKDKDYYVPNFNLRSCPHHDTGRYREVTEEEQICILL